MDYEFPACGNKEVLKGFSYFLIKYLKILFSNAFCFERDV